MPENTVNEVNVGTVDVVIAEGSAIIEEALTSTTSPGLVKIFRTPGDKRFAHVEATVYGDLSDAGTRNLVTALEAGEAASRAKLAELAQDAVKVPTV